MAGMLNEAVARKIGPETAEVETPNLDGGEEEPNVTPEEQKAYEGFVADGMLLIYEGGEVRPSILELLDENPADLVAILGDVEALKEFSPVVALAATATVIVLELVRRAGDQRPEDDIIFHAGREILEDLATLAGEAKIHDFSEQEMNKAFYIALDLYREAAAQEGLIDVDQLKAEFEEIKQADAEGLFGDGQVPGGAA